MFSLLMALVASACSAGCLELTVKVRPVAYRSGDDVEISTQLVNRSRVPVRVCDNAGFVVDKILIGGRSVTSGVWVTFRNQDLAPNTKRWLKPREAITWGGLGLTGFGGGDGKVFYYTLDRPGAYSVRFAYRCPGVIPTRVLSNWVQVVVDPMKRPLIEEGRPIVVP